MSVLVTMRVKVHDFEGTRRVAELLVKSAKQAGCMSSKIYRSDKDPNDVLWLMEWESHEACNQRGDEAGDDINASLIRLANGKIWYGTSPTPLRSNSALENRQFDTHGQPRPDIYDIYLEY